MDTEQYEEAVRDYEKVYQTEKTKGGTEPLEKVSSLFFANGVFVCLFD